MPEKKEEGLCIETGRGNSENSRRGRFRSLSRPRDAPWNYLFLSRAQRLAHSYLPLTEGGSLVDSSAGAHKEPAALAPVIFNADKVCMCIRRCSAANKIIPGDRSLEYEREISGARYGRRASFFFLSVMMRTLERVLKNSRLLSSSRQVKQRGSRGAQVFSGVDAQKLGILLCP